MGKDKGRFSSNLVEVFSWEIQPGLNSQQLLEPLELDYAKEKVILGYSPMPFQGPGAVMGTEGSSNKFKQAEPMDPFPFPVLHGAGGGLGKIWGA